MKSRLPENDITPLAEDKEARVEDENFLSRWSRRKHESKQIQESVENAGKAVSESEPSVDRLLTDADMPPLESLTEDSDYSGFLSPRVSEALRKQALRKLFHSAGINVRDGLNEYDEDFTEFAELGSIVTADLKHRVDRGIHNHIDDVDQAPVDPVSQGEPEEKQPEQDQVSADDVEQKDKAS